MNVSDEHHWSHRLASAICTRPMLIIVVAAALMAAAIGLTAWRLEFQSDRNALIDSDIPWNQRYIDWWEQFPNQSDLLVIIDAGRPVPGQSPLTQYFVAQTASAELAHALQSRKEIKRVFAGAATSAWSGRAARMLSLEQFAATIDQLQNSTTLLKSPDVASFLDSTISAARAAEDEISADSPDAERDAAMIERIIGDVGRLIATIEYELANPESNEWRHFLLPSADSWQPLQEANGRFFYLRVTPNSSEGSLLAAEDAIAAVRETLEEFSIRHGLVDFGLTGVEVIESDETTVAATDSAIASCIAVVLISVLLILSLRSVVVPLLLVLALLTGVAWSFGFLTLSIGHLQVLSVVFVVILLGLGIDFGIHLVAALEQVRQGFPNDGGFPPALALAYRRCGPGVVFGALTTATAFFATTLTDFTGVAEMGLIACGGIVLCVIAMMTVLPALLQVFRGRPNQLRYPDERGIDVFRAEWLAPVARRCRTVLIVAGVLVTIALSALPSVRFDYDLMALLPRGVDSVRWQQRLERHSDRSIWYAVSIVDSLDEATEMTMRFRALPTVAEVGGVGMLTPRDDEQKKHLIEGALTSIEPLLADALDASTSSHAEAGDSATRLREQILTLEMQLLAARQFEPMSNWLLANIDRAEASCQKILSLTDPLDQTRRERVQELDAAFRKARAAIAQRIKSQLDAGPLTPEDLPRDLLAEAIDLRIPEQTRYALYIFPETTIVDDSISPLSDEFLPGFIADLRTVDPNVTGVPVQIYESGDLIKSSFLRIGIFALIAVLALTWLTFRSLFDALLALAPVAIGFALTFGLMGLTGVNLNPANIIVLPLMFGIGVDAGIHIIHRVRADPQDQPLGLAHGTGKAITLTALTTMIGFASMMIARHRGIASLGLVMTTGLGFTLLACWLVMPALLQVRARWKKTTGSAS